MALFFSGMAVATFLHDGYTVKIDNRLGAAGVIACLILVTQCFSEVHNGLSIALLAGPFYIICQGNSLFGLLTSNAAQRLGHISYGVYLMQGIVLTLFYWAAPVKTFALSSEAHYWTTTVVCALILTMGAALLYASIERPGIELGRKISAKIYPRKT